MNKKKKYIIIGFVVLLILITSFLYLNFNTEDNTTSDFLKKDSKIENLSKTLIIKDTAKVEKLPQIVPKALSSNNTNVSLSVLDKKYELSIKAGATVFEVMKTLEEKDVPSNDFSFKYKEVSGLGSFVTEINEVRGTPGKYWIYYLNDKLASVGVSKYVLKDGDIINWKNEGM